MTGAAFRRGALGGFTLLEVMVALMIVSVSIVAIAGINSGSMSMHAYSKQLTVATLLARSKMSDIEQKLLSEGLPADDETEDGDFSDEGFPKIHWKAEIIRPKTEEIQVADLLSSLGVGSGDDSALGGFLDSQLLSKSSFYGGDASNSGITTDVGSALGSTGLLGGVLTSQLQTMVDSLGNSMREVRLTVGWGGKDKDSATDSFTVVTHVVSLGQGTDQKQSDTASEEMDSKLKNITEGTSSGSGTVRVNGVSGNGITGGSRGLK